MFLIAGLGNPGKKYIYTRHNVGFLIIDKLLENLTYKNINNTNFQSLCYKSDEVILSKPQTFMNSSGIAIYAIKRFYKIENQNIIIIHDDLDLPFGSIKFKLGGGNGGHNGLKSIDHYIGNNYIRVRVGIGKPQNKSEVINYVLKNFSQEELQKLNLDIIPHTIKAINVIIKQSLDIAKSQYTLKNKA
jgi:PTH1 family peptidyl-tRNA hydrolase